MDKETEIVSPDEAKAEEEALAEAKEDELREKLSEELGIEPDSDLLDKLVERELGHKKKLSAAIGQKIDWRKKATSSAPKPKTEDKEAALDVEKQIRAEFEARDLEELDLPDELKEDVKKLAQTLGVSVRKAAQDPYIVYRKQAIEQERKSDDATISRSASKGQKVRFDTTTPPKVDMSTEEGRKTWKEYTEFLKGQ